VALTRDQLLGGTAIPALQARSRRSQDRLTEAGLEVLAEQGPDAVTVAAVAERAGLAVGTVYRRFGNKEQLLAALQHAFIRGFEADIERNAIGMEALGDPRDRVARAVRAVSKAFQRHGRLMGVLMLLGTRNESVRAEGQRASQAGRHQFSRWLEDVELVHSDREASLDFAYRMVYAACAHRVTHGAFLESNRPVGWTEFHRELADVVCSYLLKRPTG
jgi:AcrR family transcriptional regulator